MSEEPEFFVAVAEVGGRRIDVIQVLRSVASLSLWQASQWLAELPAALPERMPFQQGRDAVARLRAAGATAGLRCRWCERAVDPAAPVDPGPCSSWRSAPCPASR